MPTAKCVECSHEQRWRSKRGVRLKNIPCEKCGGKLRRLTKEERDEAWKQYQEKMRIWKENHPDEVEKIKKMAGTWRKAEG